MTVHHTKPFTVRNLDTGIQAGSRFTTEPEALGFLHLVMRRHPGEAYAVYRDEAMVGKPQTRYLDSEIDLLRRIAEALEHIEDALRRQDDDMLARDRGDGPTPPAPD